MSHYSYCAASRVTVLALRRIKLPICRLFKLLVVRRVKPLVLRRITLRVSRRVELLVLLCARTINKRLTIPTLFSFWVAIACGPERARSGPIIDSHFTIYLLYLREQVDLIYITGRVGSGRVGTGVLEIFRVGSDQEVSYHGSGRVKCPRLKLSRIGDRPNPTRPNPTRPARFDLTRDMISSICTMSSEIYMPRALAYTMVRLLLVNMRSTEGDG